MKLRIIDHLQSCIPTSLMWGRFMRVRRLDWTILKKHKSLHDLTASQLLSHSRPQMELPLWAHPTSRLWYFFSEPPHGASVRVSSTADATLPLQQRVSGPSPRPAARVPLCVATGEVMCTSDRCGEKDIIWLYDKDIFSSNRQMHNKKHHPKAGKSCFHIIQGQF